ncbi:MAG: TetR/AcrR family transcriptional regulator [Gaiellaceae bacterium]
MRKYELKDRAESVAQTRTRIVEATVELHEQIGPARTTISAIADRAGVQRLTVYRHFPDEHALFRACSAHWRARHPLPDPGKWALVPIPEERLRTALNDLYAFFRETEGMTGNLLRDLPESPALRDVAQPFVRYWQEIREVLGDGWKAKDRQSGVLHAVIGHAIDFETWRSLVRREALTNEEAVEVMVNLACAVGC